MEDRKNKDAAASETSPVPSTDAGADLGPSSAIGKRLKAYYDDAAGEPVPDRFLSLLDALDTAESNSQTSKRS